MSFRIRLIAGLGAALVVAACNETITKPPVPVQLLPPVPPAPSGFYSLTVSSPTLSVVQGSSGTASVTVVRTNFTGTVTLVVDMGTLDGIMPPGVTASWTPNPVAGNSSVLTLMVDTVALPGVHDVVVSGIERPTPGVPPYAWFELTVVPGPCMQTIQQWATTATP